MSTRRALEERFHRAHARALALPGVSSRPALPEARLVPALRESMLAAALLDGGTCPEPLARYYCDEMPAARVEQLHRDGEGRELLWHPIELDRAPILRGTLEAIERILRDVDLDPARLFDAPDSKALLRARPTAAQLFGHALFGSGVPFLGAHPAERPLLLDALARGESAESVIDRLLCGNLVHELCHGPLSEWSEAPPPWLLLEAAALTLGARAHPEHVFPRAIGEAIPGVSLFVLLGDALARLFGDRALFSLNFGATELDAFGPRVGAAFRAAGWQDWLQRRQPPFAPHALDAMAWVKLADACRGEIPLDADRLLSSADRLAWRDLPWWREEITPADLALVPRAFEALCQVHVFAPTFQTHPSDPPNRKAFLDVERCVVRAERRSEGVFAEPARWLVPPNVCARLAEQGVTTVRIEGLTCATWQEAGRRLVQLEARGAECVIDLR